MDICIIGAGLSGLSLAYMLNDRKFNVKILEKDKRIGGLLRSEEINGWTFDTGGSHILFSKNKIVLREILNVLGEYVEHRRKSYIYYKNKFIKYPFENGIYDLPAYERYEILKDVVQTFLKRKMGILRKPGNLLEWFYYVFGKAITEKYLKPYNEKLWKRDLKKISLDWVGNRIPNPPIYDIMKSAIGIPTEGYRHQIRFYYPLRGGIEALIRRLSELISYPIITSVAVKGIKKEDEKVVLKTDKMGEIVCDYVVSTAPLNEIAGIVSENRCVKSILKKFDYNSLVVVGLGIKNRAPKYHWIYVPQKEIIFHRIAFLSNYSPNMSPNGYSSLIAEISHKPDEDMKDDDIEDCVLEGLREMGFDFDVELVKIWRWKYAYIVYNHDYREVTGKICEFLMRNRIIPFGRFGSWSYLNMDSVWMEAKRLAERLRCLYEGFGSNT